MKKIIIGVHGLKNKPGRKTLYKWWRKSIKDGLELFGCPINSFTFKMAHWAHILYPKPLDPAITDREDPQFLDYGYYPPGPEEAPPKEKRDKNQDFSPVRKKLLDTFEFIMDRVLFTDKGFINYDQISEKVIQHLFKDLDTYYYGSCTDRKNRIRPAKTMVRNELEKLLVKYRKREILLLTHSMGSIIALDILGGRENRKTGKYKINTLITIGSPLGLPVIIKKYLAENNYPLSENSPVQTPEGITGKWLNFSDLEDPVAVNYNLGDDYRENSHHVKPEDFIVTNHYTFEGTRDRHGEIGYLRTPEVARAVCDFLKKSTAQMPFFRFQS